MSHVFKQFVSFLLPLTNAVLIPYLIIGNSRIAILDQSSGMAKFKFILGAFILIIGLFVLVSTIRTFILVGKGTLAPWSPTSNLIVGGVYAYIRNPMISGVLFILIGEALVFNSAGLAVWSVVFFILNHVYFILSEEPGLGKRFGSEYEAYKSNVPRWIPRVKPWKPQDK